MNRAFDGRATESKGTFTKIWIVFISIHSLFIETPSTRERIKLMETEPVKDELAV